MKHVKKPTWEAEMAEKESLFGILREVATEVLEQEIRIGNLARPSESATPNSGSETEIKKDTIT